MTAVMVDVGQVLAGYRLVREVGRGGAGVVYEAVNDATGECVAVKTLQVDLTHDAGQRAFARFVAEVQTVRRIQHPHVVRVLEAGKGQDRAGRALGFFAMELLPGGTLKQRVDQGGPLTVPEAARVVEQAASGVGAAHAAGVIHRDIKPENVLFAEDGRAVVVDFGVCKFAADQDLTATGEMVGTIRYMAPEQAMHSTADARSDVFGLGALLFFALTGEHLRPEPDVGTLFRAVMQQQDLLRVDQSVLGGEVKAFLRRALATDPEVRIPTAAALAEQLQALAAGTSPVAPEVALLPDALFNPQPGSTESLELAQDPLEARALACEFCGVAFPSQAALDGHAEHCSMRQWHERNFLNNPPVLQMMLTEVEAPPVPEPEPETWWQRLLRWVRGTPLPAPPVPPVDELQQLREQVATLQDADAVRLGGKGLELLAQMMAMVAQGDSGAALAGMLRPQLLTMARKLVQMCAALHFGRQFLVHFPPGRVERELQALQQRGGSPETLARKQALLQDVRGVQGSLRAHAERLQAVVDGLGQSTARLQGSLVSATPADNALVRGLLTSLDRDLDAMGDAMAEMRRMGME